MYYIIKISNEILIFFTALVWRHMRVHKKWRPRVLRSLKAVKQRRLELLKPPTSEEIPKVEKVKKNKYYSEKICQICDRKFVNGKTLSKHIKTVHNKIKPFNCNVCGKKTARKASLIVSFLFNRFIQSQDKKVLSS